MMCHFCAICLLILLMPMLSTRIDGKSETAKFEAAKTKMGFLCPNETAVSVIQLHKDGDGNNRISVQCVNVSEHKNANRPKSCKWMTACRREHHEHPPKTATYLLTAKTELFKYYGVRVPRGVRLARKQVLEFYCCEQMNCVETCETVRIKKSNEIKSPDSEVVTSAETFENFEKKSPQLLKYTHFQSCQMKCPEPVPVLTIGRQTYCQQNPGAEGCFCGDGTPCISPTTCVQGLYCIQYLAGKSCSSSAECEDQVLQVCHTQVCGFCQFMGLASTLACCSRTSQNGVCVAPNGNCRFDLQCLGLSESVCGVNGYCALPE